MKLIDRLQRSLITNSPVLDRMFFALARTEIVMSTTADELVSEVRALPDAEKMRLLDAILTDLHKPDPKIEHVWADEARKRWAAYKAGRIPTVSYEDVMAKHRE